MCRTGCRHLISAWITLYELGWAPLLKSSLTDHAEIRRVPRSFFMNQGVMVLALHNIQDE